MDTFLFDRVIFGPVPSRRLGNSLGINLLPTTCKICNFNCIYCECGWTKSSNDKGKFPERRTVKNKLKRRLKQAKAENEQIDVITFAGNGEPTLHPYFADIIMDTIQIRNEGYEKAKIAVLSNASMNFNPNIINALKLIDLNILKLDSGIESTIKKLNQPLGNFNMEKLVANLKSFDSNLIVQSMFVKAHNNEMEVDNTSSTEITEWLEKIKEIKPKQVMIYSIARNTPMKNLEKIPVTKLHEIAMKVKKEGIDVIVSS